MKIYLASALTHVPKDHFTQYTESLHAIARKLEETDSIEVKYALINSDPQLSQYPEKDKARLCYEWDREMVLSSDLIIAECSFPSTGLGIEVQLAEQHQIPVIIIFKDFGDNVESKKIYSNPDEKKYELQIGEGIVSLMLLGNPAVLFSRKYSDYKEVAEILKDTVIKMPTYNILYK